MLKFIVAGRHGRGSGLPYIFGCRKIVGKFFVDKMSGKNANFWASNPYSWKS